MGPALASALWVCVAQAAVVHWTVFNPEGESESSVGIAVDGSLDDMLFNQNRQRLVFPGSSNFGQNIVGSGAFLVDDGGNGSPGAVSRRCRCRRRCCFWPGRWACLGCGAGRGRETAPGMKCQRSM